MLGNRLLNPRDSGRGPGASAPSPMKPATAVHHCWALAACPASGLRTTPERRGEVTRRVAVPQPAAPHTTFHYFRRLFPAVHGVIVHFRSILEIRQTRFRVLANQGVLEPVGT